MDLEHVGDDWVLQDIVDELHRGPGAYKPRVGLVEEVIIHQTAGNTHVGLQGPRNTATFHTAQPIWATEPDGTLKRDRRGRRILVGGGRYWPGIAYHLFVPYNPLRDDAGRLVVYRTQPDGVVSYHTGGAANRLGIGVALQGLFASRHHHIPDAKPGPSPEQMQLLPLLWNYLADRYGMRASEGLKGHFDYGKPSCPGDVAEAWVRQTRGEEFELLGPDTDPAILRPTPLPIKRVSLAGWMARERALWLVGLMQSTPDGVYDLKTRIAIESFQQLARIQVDGIWGPQTEAAMRSALRDIGRDDPSWFLDMGAMPRLWQGPA